MIDRAYRGDLVRKLSHFPVVTILGPRQCGKTTFIRSALPEWSYVDCERPSDYEPLLADPERRLRQLGDFTIFDEAHRVPELFPVLRSYVDEERSRSGRIVLLGSVSPELVAGISESLAGRSAFIELTPFLLSEVVGRAEDSLGRLWFRGGFPDPFLWSDDATVIDWFDAYSRTFIERDLNALGVSISSQRMRQLWAMLCHVSGGMWNASDIASSMGVNYQTVNRYVEILERAFLVRRLQPYFVNISKRIVRRPKLYVRDSGILHHFLGVRTAAQLDVHPSRGASWESFVVEQIISTVELDRPGAGFYFWRTSGGAEVDLLIEIEGTIIPFEVKVHSSPSRGLTKGLRSCMSDLHLRRGYVVYPGAESYSLGSGVDVVPVQRLLTDAEYRDSVLGIE
ncbi:MAG: ATP-binding protein [Spirochaetales bacterium]|nr:ATP-binding protein [Spirochaetales bacterium]